MKKSGFFAEKRGTTAVQPDWLPKAKQIAAKADSIISMIVTWVFRLRKFLLAAPVVYYAVKLASYNMEHLPEQVGINLQASGEFAQTVTRQFAVIGPLGLTFACLLLMFCSRKAIYSWAISIFTLALPVLLLFSNTYPS